MNPLFLGRAKVALGTDEVGILLGCNPPFDVTATLKGGNLSNWWNIQAAVWALYVGELSAAGVDMVGASQFVGWPVGPAGTPVGVPAGNAATGCPFQSQIGVGGNCPEMSMIDWTNGALNSRSWTMKMMIDGLGNKPKQVLETNVSMPGKPDSTRKHCKALTRTADQDFAGSDLCEFNMTERASHGACGEACCAHPLCDKFVTVQGDPPYRFAGGGVCDGEPPCAEGGFCCFLKTSAAAPIKSMYKPGSCISGTTTPSVAIKASHFYARAFAPQAGESWPGPGKRAILMANLDSRRTHTVAFDGLKGARLWSVVHGESGEWETPFAESTSTADTLAMQPLAVVLAFVQ